jgi:hypothetical protein
VLALLALAGPGTAAARAAPAPAADPRPAPPAATPLRPYTAFSWSFAGPRDKVKPMYWIQRATPPGVAAQATARMAAGSRVVLTVDFGRELLVHPGDACMTPDGKPAGHQGVWPVHGARAAAEEFDNYLRHFAAAGGQIDMLVLDYEGNNSCWWMTAARLEAIGADPRFKQLVPALGFADPLKALPQNSTARGEYLRWNAVMDRLVMDAMEQALLAPLRRHFPRAGLSNFDGQALPPENVIPELNGHMQYRLGDPVGTHQSPAVYGGILASAAVPTVDWTRPFVQVVYAANLVRTAVRSSPRPVMPWVAHRGFHRPGGKARPSVWGGTDYWQEGMYHALLSGGTTNLLYWNPPSRLPPPHNQSDTENAVPADDDATEAVMAEVERAAGGQLIVAAVATDQSPWDPPFIASAARLADGATLARVTFAEKTTEASITVGGRQVRVAKPPGKLGAWVRMPAEPVK